jgi:penicillin-binding protein 1B
MTSGTRRAIRIGMGVWFLLLLMSMTVLGVWTATRLRLPDPTPTGLAVVHVLAGSEELGTLRPDFRRAKIWVPLSRIPRDLVDAVLLTEDRRFFDHGGLDGRSIVRALLINARSSNIRQGASTITQQLARTVFLSTDRTWRRKIAESVAAILLEFRYSKTQILEAYLNTIYLGQDGDVEIRGMGAAARYYLGLNLESVDLDQAALLASAIHAPNRILGGEPRRAAVWRNRVLAAMRAAGRITDAAFREAVGRPIGPWANRTPVRAPYFLDVVRDELARRAALPSSGEVRLLTTLDPRLQGAAEQAVRDTLRSIERKHPELGTHTLQAAAVAMDPASGEIRALVGGRRYAASHFNRAVRALRQPGSAFKPLVYLAAFESDAMQFTPASLVEDTPLEIATPQGPWAPHNLDHRYRGAVTVRQALEQSLNVPTVRVAQAVGTPAIIRLAHELGVASPLRDVPSLALGTSEVTLLELTAAYAAIANTGLRVAPTVLEAGRQDDRVRPAPNPPPLRIVSAESAYLVTALLQGVMQNGTGRPSARWGLDRLTAGKSGSSSDLRDAWFVGYTPDLAVGVWVGLDDDTPLGLTGSEAALPIWGALMASAVKRIPPHPFQPADGIVFAAIDAQTGRRPNGVCGSPRVISEAFRTGTVPDAGGCPAMADLPAGGPVAFEVSPQVVIVGAPTGQSEAPGSPEHVISPALPTALPPPANVMSPPARQTHARTLPEGQTVSPDPPTSR